MQAIDPEVRYPGPDGYAHKLRVLGLSLAIVALPWSTGGVSIGVGLLVLGALFAPRGTMRNAVHPWVIQGCLALCAVFLLSALLSENISRGLYEVKGLWPCLALVAGAATTRDARRPWIFPALWLLTASSAALYVLYEILLGHGHWSPSRMLPTNVWRFNLTLAHGMACGIAIALQARDLRVRGAALVAGLLTGAAFFQIGERMPVLTAALLLACGLPMLAIRQWGMRRAGLASIAALLVVASILANNSQLERSFALGFDGFIEREHKRLAMWSSAWSLFQEAPLLGVGIGDASDALQAEMVATHGIADAPTWQAHSNLFHALAATGIIGAALYLLWTLALIAPWFAKRSLLTPAGFLCLWAWCQFATGGITDGTLFLSYFFAPFCLLYAVSTGIAAASSAPQPAARKRTAEERVSPAPVATADFPAANAPTGPTPSPGPKPSSAPAAMVSADAARRG